ncbi:MAG: hypothetical protein JNL05_00610 [Flavobacteriales bacterium]|nr:hypothetical protein [Flavobacteriales bacterium]
MWLHGLGVRWPPIDRPVLGLLRRGGTPVCGGFLVPASRHGHPARTLLHHLVCALHPLRPTTTACAVHRRHPPTGLQLAPGQPLHLCLVAATATPAPAFYLRRWLLLPCPRHHARWAPEPGWLPLHPAHCHLLAATPLGTTGLTEHHYALHLPHEPPPTPAPCAHIWHAPPALPPPGAPCIAQVLWQRRQVQQALLLHHTGTGWVPTHGTLSPRPFTVLRWATLHPGEPDAATA